jgi:hypothetical protein
MQLHRGNMFDSVDFGYGIYCVTTTNNVVTQNGLVMGAGHALEVALRWPGIKKEFGDCINQMEDKDYGVLASKQDPVIAFQTKRHFKDKSPLDLILFSTRKLLELSLATSTEE